MAPDGDAPSSVTELIGKRQLCQTAFIFIPT